MVSLPSMLTSPATLTAPELELREQARAFLAETPPWGHSSPAWACGWRRGQTRSSPPQWRSAVGSAWRSPRAMAVATPPPSTALSSSKSCCAGAPRSGITGWPIGRSPRYLVRYGTEEQKRWLLPRICRGELCFCIGMSEPDAGSDLASVRTRGVRDGDGWRVSGVKVWTSNAMRADFMIALCRTGEGARHQGLSRFLIDMRSPGVTVKPIPFLNGSTDHFAEVVLDGVPVPDEMVIGDIGQGWAQNANELAFERSGPDRWISTFLLVQEFVREWPDLATTPAGRCRLIGETRGAVLGVTAAFAGRGQGDRRGRHASRPRPRSSRRCGTRFGTGCRQRAAGVVGRASSSAARRRRRHRRCSNGCCAAQCSTRRRSPSAAVPMRCCALSPPAVCCSLSMFNCRARQRNCLPCTAAGRMSAKP